MYNNTKLFTKMLRFISKPKFNAFVKKFQSDKHYRKFFSYQHFLAFVFAQFNNTTSLRELNSAMNVNCNLKKVLPFDSINLSSLSRANNHRPYQLFENSYECIRISSFIYLIDMPQIYPTRRELFLRSLMALFSHYLPNYSAGLILARILKRLN